MKGAKYIGYRPVKQVAVSVRQDLKDAVKSGALPAGLKFSVTIGTGSCNVLRVKVSGVQIETDLQGWRTGLCKKVYDTVDSIANAYNRNESDVMVDYWDVDYYCHVQLNVQSWQWL